MMSAGCNSTACHAHTTSFNGGTYLWQGSTDPRFFDSEGTAFTFAKNRSISGNPGGSLFLKKPSGACTVGTPCSSLENPTSHGGGTVWPNPSSGYTAATNWINGGLSARNILPRLLPWHQPAAGAVIAEIRPAPAHRAPVDLDLAFVPGR